MTKTDFIAEVQAELDHLQEQATQEEKDNLVIGKLNPHKHDMCIYGLMTANCYSSRAKELYPKKYEFIEVRGHEMDEYTQVPFDKHDFITDTPFYTPLEKYLYMVLNENGTTSDKHVEIIKYIKGEIEAINLAVI